MGQYPRKLEDMSSLRRQFVQDVLWEWFEGVRLVGKTDDAPAHLECFEQDRSFVLHQYAADDLKELARVILFRLEEHGSLV